MTLEEAIKHCEEVADSKCDACGAEHKQLAEWLIELKGRRKGGSFNSNARKDFMDADAYADSFKEIMEV